LHRIAIQAFTTVAHGFDLRQFGDLGHFGGDQPRRLLSILKVLILRLEPSLGSGRPISRDGH
jgi:hypothetical protein